LLFRYSGIYLEAEYFFAVTDQQQFSQKEKQQIVYGFDDGV
jgi:hypothetical protein